MANPQPERGTTRIAHDLLEAIISRGFSGREIRVILKIARETYGWSRKAAKISYGEIARATGISRRNVISICQRLAEMRVIKVVKGSDFHPAMMAINKDYDQWLLSINGVAHDTISKIENPDLHSVADDTIGNCGEVVNKVLKSAGNSVADNTPLVSCATPEVVSPVTLLPSVAHDTTSKQYRKTRKQNTGISPKSPSVVTQLQGARDETVRLKTNPEKPEAVRKVRELISGFEGHILNGGAPLLVDRLAGAGFDRVRAWTAIVAARRRRNPPGFLVTALAQPRFALADSDYDEAKREMAKHGY